MGLLICNNLSVNQMYSVLFFFSICSIICAFIHFSMFKVLIFSEVNVMAVSNAKCITSPTTNASSDMFIDFKAIQPKT